MFAGNLRTRLRVNEEVAKEKHGAPVKATRVMEWR